MVSELEKQLYDALEGLLDGLSSEHSNGNPVPRSLCVRARIVRAKAALAAYEEKAQEQRHEQY